MGLLITVINSDTVTCNGLLVDLANPARSLHTMHDLCQRLVPSRVDTMSTNAALKIGMDLAYPNERSVCWRLNENGIDLAGLRLCKIHAVGARIGVGMDLARPCPYR